MNINGPIHVVVPEYPATSALKITPIQGMIVGIGVQYNFMPYSTTLDLAIIAQGDNQPDQDLLALSGGNTDGWFYPARQNCDLNGAPIAALYTRGMPVFGDVEIDISNALPGDSVDITFLLGV